MAVICTICARGGSTGVLRKNVRLLDGKPLIAHSIEQALNCSFLDGVYVSTDDDEIADVARSYGATVPFMRPAEMATKLAPKLPVIEHLVDHLVTSGIKVSTIVDLDPTSPLRAVSDIQGAFLLLDEKTDVVITGYEADKNPYYNMVEEKSPGQFGLVKSPEQEIFARQNAPKVYSMNGSVYVWHRDTLKARLWSGRTRLYEMPRERSIDIDSEIDFELVELFMRKAKG